MQSVPVRIQVKHNTLGILMETIVESHMADRTWAKWVNMRVSKGKPVGGAIMQRADLPRYWES
jgi:hypothetical protein